MQTLSRRTAALAPACLRWLAGCLLVAGAAGCGYKGPLYLPPPEAPPETLTEPPVTGPNPSQSAR